ncbi:type VI secretion system protein TssA [Aquabacterium sp.]|uniref:type VI secretion system protein TssA n=1 Tax=Aquabacterium sp. TaxID=1872578 RepID=UPI0035B4831D
MSESSGDLDPSDLGSAERTIVDDWLEPLADTPCGEDLEYDNEFLALAQLAAGKPETQFAEAEPPDWRKVRDAAAALFGRTRDLRVAMHWVRANLRLEEFAALPDSLRLLRGLLQNFWSDLHPKLDPDDGDAYARLNVLALLGEVEGVVGDVRNALVVHHRAVGELRVRDVEVMLGKYPPREGETPLSRAQVEQMLGAAIEQEPALATLPARAAAQLRALASLLNDKVGIERAPDTRPLHNLIACVVQVMPAGGATDTPDAADAPTEGEADGSAGERPSGKKGLGDGVYSRADALRAIDMVCDYLERTEPTNPAQLLLRRARRLINKNFLQLMRELAPDALNEVARIMGVDPESIQSESEEG